jgi:hypothetical protein
MLTCSNKALVEGDDNSIVNFGFPTDNVNINDAIYDCYATVIFSVQFDGVAIEFILFEKEARNKKMSFLHVAQYYNNKDLTFTFCRSTV